MGARQPRRNHWRPKTASFRISRAGANIRTTRKFDDFKLHIEYNCPRGGNSGVYLRGRYEVQVEYEPAGKNDAFHAMGSIYGFIPPGAEVTPRPGQWEGYDVTLVGRNSHGGSRWRPDHRQRRDSRDYRRRTGQPRRRARAALPARRSYRRIKVPQYHHFRAPALNGRCSSCTSLRKRFSVSSGWISRFIFTNSPF